MAPHLDDELRRRVHVAAQRGEVHARGEEDGDGRRLRDGRAVGGIGGARGRRRDGRDHLGVGRAGREGQSDGDGRAVVAREQAAAALCGLLGRGDGRNLGGGSEFFRPGVSIRPKLAIDPL